MLDKDDRYESRFLVYAINDSIVADSNPAVTDEAVPKRFTQSDGLGS